MLGSSAIGPLVRPHQWYEYTNLTVGHRSNDAVPLNREELVLRHM